VLSPVSSGIGGGCFILSFNGSSGSSEFIDARETAPAAAKSDMFAANPSAARDGPLVSSYVLPSLNPALKFYLFLCVGHWNSG
jgi:gamma-glutamyltranspeptidase